MKSIVLVAALAAVVTAGAAGAQSADTILVNGKVITLDPRSSVAQAIAIRDGKVLATGTDGDIRTRADGHTKVVDLGGRTVIPGLMDSHIHALRAGLTYAVEVSWIGVPSLAKGLDIIREAARTAKPGAWIKIGGGWTELQFSEKRGPTVAELVAAAPDRPVYVQRLYNTAWITPAGVKLMGLTPSTKIPGGKAEIDDAGNLTGVFTGVNATFNFFTAKIPAPTFAEQLAGTKKYFRELNRLGMTAVNDYPGGGMLPEHFRAVQTLWQNGEQTLRVTFHISADRLADFKTLTAFTPMNFGDDWLRYRGIGESLTRGIYDGSTVGPALQPLRQGPRRVLRGRALGRRARHQRPPACGERQGGVADPRLLRGGEQGIPDSLAALADRASGECLRRHLAADEGARHGLGGAGPPALFRRHRCQGPRP